MCLTTFVRSIGATMRTDRNMNAVRGSVHVADAERRSFSAVASRSGPSSFFAFMPARLPALLPSFTARIDIIGVNPFVFLPTDTLHAVFAQAGKNKGPVPVHGTIDGHAFIQTLVRFSGHWRLYLNGPMLKATRRSVGEQVKVRIAFDPRDRTTPMPAVLEAALDRHPKARAVFDGLAPSRRKEIMRYIGNLKSEEAITRNVARAIAFLEGRERFAGRDRP